MAARTMVAFVTLALLPIAAPADPTSWAPSGWRGNGEPAYLGYNDREWDNDYGVVRGRCDTAALGLAIDARRGRRTVAVMVGPSVIADMDERDRACIGQALELAGKKTTVIWKNDATGVGYRLTPTRNFRRDGLPCREFTTRVSVNGRVRAVYGAACRHGDGEWRFIG